jgi:ribose transport system substrate-binding protein
LNRLHVLLSLTNSANDYQVEQACAAEETARRLNAQMEIVYAENDSINQSQQLLNAIQSGGRRPDAIAFEAVGTALSQVARAAVSAGIGWAVLNGEADYILQLRTLSRAPVFRVGTDHVEVGRVQGRQLRALLPDGGMALYISGPSMSSAAAQRAAGLQETKQANLRLRSMKADWTHEGASAAILAWLRLSTSRTEPIVAIVAQNDAMAMGARQAFEEQSCGVERDRWLGLPFLGCDALANTGAAWVREGHLAASIKLPTTARCAVEMMVESLGTGVQPPESTILSPTSFPPIELLKPRQ